MKCGASSLTMPSCGLRIITATDCVSMPCMHSSTFQQCILWNRSQSKWNVLVRPFGKEFHLIAESDLNDPRIVRPREANGYGMDSQWSDDFHHSSLRHALQSKGRRDRLLR